MSLTRATEIVMANRATNSGEDMNLSRILLAEQNLNCGDVESY
jgi:hypothetical protein